MVLVISLVNRKNLSSVIFLDGLEVIESIPKSRDSALLRIRFGNENRETRKVWRFGIIQAGTRNQKQGIRN